MSQQPRGSGLTKLALRLLSSIQGRQKEQKQSRQGWRRRRRWEVIITGASNKEGMGLMGDIGGHIAGHEKRIDVVVNSQFETTTVTLACPVLMVIEGALLRTSTQVRRPINRDLVIKAPDDRKAHPMKRRLRGQGPEGGQAGRVRRAGRMAMGHVPVCADGC